MRQHFNNIIISKTLVLIIRSLSESMWDCEYSHWPLYYNSELAARNILHFVSVRTSPSQSFNIRRQGWYGSCRSDIWVIRYFMQMSPQQKTHLQVQWAKGSLQKAHGMGSTWLLLLVIMTDYGNGVWSSILAMFVQYRAKIIGQPIYHWNKVKNVTSHFGIFVKHYWPTYYIRYFCNK